MDKVTKYKKIIRQLFEAQLEQFKPHRKGAILQLAMDDETGQYLMLHNAWINQKRNYGCFLHLSIRNDKIYVENDGTDPGFTLELLKAGIPKEDIVLAFHAPIKRPYTGFAVS